MNDFRIESAVALDDHRIKVRWTDGLEGVVDFSDLMSDGIFTALRDPRRFRDVRVAEYGHTIYWLGDGGIEIDICPDVLRSKVDPEVAAWIAEQEHRWQSRSAAE
ncbi:DUF2442 domain-containing protein [Mesorhizobium sp. LHD-90]|uniref:DUF2442 domain-containing protein n=1 Tax=Mesorhizobium sp. LHD-90 TaxID=3071414 RepID=UPI0027DF9F32|nr:DUF2442 domain-containing protein [Mesorhizobium sp. LHD-90]MDQ6437079.1 DUF2442 domain-containing protein [Mesorhizobium sp. LHD-90]